LKSQIQIFYEEQRKIAAANEVFLELVADGMTREELQTNIDRRPAAWKRFEGFLSKLPTGATA
jgi:hypothetical protein